MKWIFRSLQINYITVEIFCAKCVDVAFKGVLSSVKGS